MKRTRWIGYIAPGLAILAMADEFGLEAERAESGPTYTVAGCIDTSGHLFVSNTVPNSEFLRFTFAPTNAATLNLYTRSRNTTNFQLRLNNGDWQSIDMSATTDWSWQSALAYQAITPAPFTKLGSDTDPTIENLTSSGGTITYGTNTSRTDIGISSPLGTTLSTVGDKLVYSCTYSNIHNSTSLNNIFRVGFDFGSAAALHFHTGYGSSSTDGRFSYNTSGNPFSYGTGVGSTLSWASDPALRFNDGNTIHATYTLTLTAINSGTCDYEYTVTYQNGSASNTASQAFTGISGNTVASIYHLTNTDAVEISGDTWTVTGAQAALQSSGGHLSVLNGTNTLDIIWNNGDLDKIQLGSSMPTGSGINSPEWNRRELPAQAGGFHYAWDAYDNSQDEGLGDKTYTPNAAGVRALKHAPAAGIHPRLLFNPEELPEIKTRIATTASGQAAFKQMHAYTTLINVGDANYNRSADYALDASGNALIDNVGYYDYSRFYTNLYNESSAIWSDTSFDKKYRSLTASIMACEALECLLKEGESDPDTGLTYAERTQRLKTAAMFWASNALTDPNVTPNGFQYFPAVHMAFIYDLLFNEMTAAEQALFRQALVKVIPDLPRYGNNVAAYAQVSNWTTLDNYEILPNLAIEWEEGYKSALTREWMRVFHNFINYGWHTDGAGYEGLGKNYMMTACAVAHARRGFSMLAHPNVRAFGEQFLPAITQPFGHGFTAYDGWSGSGYNAAIGGYKFNALDAIGLKWVFPDSPQVDFMWRNYIEKNYTLSSVGYVYQQFRPDDSYLQYMIPAVVFASDYDLSNDWKNDRDYLSDRGLAVLRSGGETNSMAVHFHCRQDMGGHTDADRNSFNMSALGRIWVRTTYGDTKFHQTYFHSCPLIDGEGIKLNPKDGIKARQPATLTHFNTNTHLSKVSGDATYPYNWEWDWSPGTGDHPNIGSDGWEKVTESWNDFRYAPGTGIEFTTPFHDYAAWATAVPATERMVKRRYNTVEKVKRSLILNKDPHPYLLVIDDLKKDASTHDYEWVAQIANDLVPLSSNATDIILAEPAGTGSRRLLVRVLQTEGLTTAPAAVEELEYNDTFTGEPYTPNPNYYRQRLVVRSTSIEPKFKILLYPYEDGEPLPDTQWIDANTLEITIGSEKRIIDLADISSAAGIDAGSPQLNMTADGGQISSADFSGINQGTLELQATLPPTETPRLWHTENLMTPWSLVPNAGFQWLEGDNLEITAPVDPEAKTGFYAVFEN